MAITKTAAWLFKKDAFSQWLGITIEQCTEGACTLTMVVRTEMCNGFGLAHGGITYALADSALAFASNHAEVEALSIDTSISHMKALKTGDIIVARAITKKVTGKLAWYDVTVETIDGELAALFKGTVYRRPRIY